MLLPHVDDVESVPSYVSGGKINEELLPPYLKGLSVDADNLACNEQDFNVFIHEALILPKGRENLFTTKKEPGCATNFTPRIDVDGSKRWTARLRPMHPNDRKDFKVVLDRYLAANIIEKSNSCYSSAGLLVRKRSGNNQIAMIYNELNKASKANLYPLPLIQSCLDALHGTRFKSMVDVCSGYMSICIPPEFRKYFAFITHFGLFQWVRLMYGWKNSGGNFYELMASTMEGLIYVILCVYSDDTLIFGGTTERGHIKCISLCLQRFQNRGLHLSPEKCAFFAKKLEYLGFMLVDEGLKPLPRNVKKILELDIQNVADIRRFVGFALYYRRHIHIQKFTQIAAPLYKYLRKDSRLPSPLPADVSEAIRTLKGVLTTYPVVRHPDFDKPFILETDGSLEGFSAILLQKHAGRRHVVYYASSGVMKSHKGYDRHLLEFIAAVWGMQYFRHYLRGRKFTLRCDCTALKCLSRSPELHKGLEKYIVEAQEFDFDVETVQGSEHHGPDLLSRAVARNAPVDPLIREFAERRYGQAQTTHVVKPHAGMRGIPHEYFDDMTRETWVNAQAADTGLRHAIQDPKVKKIMSQDHGLWYVTFPGSTRKLWTPKALYSNIMHIAHGLTGHRGQRPITKMLRHNLYAPGICKFAKKWISSCCDCTRRKALRARFAGIDNTRFTDIAWYRICIDFVLKELPLTEDGYRFAITIIDSFTRFPIVIPLKTKDAVEIADALFTHVFSLFGFPTVVHSDNDFTLISEALKLCFRKFGVRRTTILPGHPQGNGQVERFMRYLNATLTIVLEKYTQWPKAIPIVMLAYRSMAQETTGYSPFFLLFAREMKMPLDICWSITDGDTPAGLSSDQNSAQEYIATFTKRLEDAFMRVRRAQRLAAQRNKDLVRDKRFEVTFKVGDPVFMQEDNSASRTLGHLRTEVRPADETLVPRKWTFRWSGPHVITRFITDNAYEIFHTGQRKTVRVHVDRLRLHHPFSDKVFDTSAKNEKVKATFAPTDPRTPKIDDICVFHVPLFKPEDICVAKLLSDGSYQWYSSWGAGREKNAGLSSIELFEKTQWLPGWVCLKDNRIVYAFKRPPGCVPFSADISEFGDGPLLVGIQLNSNNRVTADTVKMVAGILKVNEKQ